MRTLVIIALLGAALTSAARAADAPYDLLEIDNWIVKWGDEKLGSGAVVTYAYASERRSFPKARNCQEIAPISKLLKATGYDETRFRKETERALAAWEKSANIKFVPAKAGQDADILIGTQGRPRGRAFANVSLPESRRLAALQKSRKLALAQESRQLNAIVDTGSARRRRKPFGIARIKKSLVCLNPVQRWKIGRDGDGEVYDLSYTLMHEIGHAIGLDHAGSRGQLMSFRYQDHLMGLQAGDIAGVRRLYGPAK